ncbi:Carbon-nitrogen hydrolase [Granulibacter bethesdensis]|uniref:carbon-nitrogen hydrolase family protein n=1 Tax=Granulibacter bethesdensis TaxID=364410 RepID=UPI0009097F49|nr:carbon-nitrogen hydrolase family protein [Granulibacter bethesdensis]APH56125.1 Carbon-nitrogen hydrolase [Granulibacter bethesdensis]
MRITVIQMNPGHDRAANIAQAATLIEAAVAAERPEMVVLPEMWACLGGERADKFAQAEYLPAPGSNAETGPAYAFLRDTARRHGIYLHGGSIGERDPAGSEERLFNTTLAFDPEGRELARYRKIHLFDVQTSDGVGYLESATYGAGREIVTYRAGPLTVGCAICYDVRFPELFLALRRQGADLIMLPAAFTLLTGKDHWETLIRARAIETQCWLAASGTYGRHEEKGESRFTYGNSMIADPWGMVVARVSDGTGWATTRIDTALSARVRQSMPVLTHRVLA